MQTEFPSNGHDFWGKRNESYTNLEGLQDGDSRLGQSVSILMNWRTGFEKRGQ
jgi:hypothetical protein